MWPPVWSDTHWLTVSVAAAGSAGKSTRCTSLSYGPASTSVNAGSTAKPSCSHTASAIETVVSSLPESRTLAISAPIESWIVAGSVMPSTSSICVAVSPAAPADSIANATAMLAGENTRLASG